MPVADWSAGVPASAAPLPSETASTAPTEAPTVEAPSTASVEASAAPPPPEPFVAPVVPVATVMSAPPIPAVLPAPKRPPAATPSGSSDTCPVLDAGPVTSLRHLSGGASRDTWAFDLAGRPLILQRELPDRYYDVGIAEQQAVLFAADSPLLSAVIWEQQGTVRAVGGLLDSSTVLGLARG